MEADILGNFTGVGRTSSFEKKKNEKLYVETRKNDIKCCKCYNAFSTTLKMADAHAAVWVTPMKEIRILELTNEFHNWNT